MSLVIIAERIRQRLLAALCHRGFPLCSESELPVSCWFSMRVDTRRMIFLFGTAELVSG